MKTRYPAFLASFLLASFLLGPVSAAAQNQSATKVVSTPGSQSHHRVPRRTGKMVAELGHRQEASTQRRPDRSARSDVSTTTKLKLIDYGADMEKQDLKLQTLLDADVPNEGQVEAQVDQVLAARGKLEREFTLMNLDLRKVLSLDQWRQLKSIRGQGMGIAGGGDRVFFRKVLPPVAGPRLLGSSRRTRVRCLRFLPLRHRMTCTENIFCTERVSARRPWHASEHYGRRFLRVKLSGEASLLEEITDEIWRHHFPGLQL